MSAVRGRWQSRTTAISRSTRGWGDFRISVSASRRPRRSSKRSGSPAPSSAPSAVSRAVSSCVASGPGVPVHRDQERPPEDLHRLLARGARGRARSPRHPAIRWSASAASRRTRAPARAQAASAPPLPRSSSTVRAPTPSLAVGERRVEQRQRVAEAPVGRAREEPERVGLDRLGRHLLLLEDPPERLADLGARDRAGSRSAGTRERIVAGRRRGSVVARTKTTCGRRLLQGLQERVERRLGEHVDFVDDVDLAAARGPARSLTFSRRVRTSSIAAIRGAVDLEHVERAARRHLAAGLALARRGRHRRCAAARSSGPSRGAAPSSSCRRPAGRRRGTRGRCAPARGRSGASG